MMQSLSAEFLKYPKADWMQRANCRGKGVDVFFMDRGEKSQAALEFCARCDVRRECLQYALNNNILHGIWGGVSVRGRRDPECATRDIKIPTHGRIVELWEKGWRYRAIAKELGVSEAHVASSLARFRKARNGF